MAVAFIDGSDRLFFIKVLFRWIGSIWQMLWIDLLVYVVLYFMLALLYRLVLVKFEVARRGFEGFVHYVGANDNGIPLSFILGFFVSAVVGRWWQMCMAIPWLNTPAFMIQSYVSKGDNLKARLYRLNMLRYFNLAWVLQFKAMSDHVSRRLRLHASMFKKKRGEAEPAHKRTIRYQAEQINADPMVKKYFGLLITEEEIANLETIGENSGEGDLYDPEYWVPLQWATELMRRARKDGVIAEDRQYVELVRITDGFRGSLGSIWCFVNFNIPLVYVQVVIIAVYSYFLSELFARQFLIDSDKPKYKFDAYIPVFTLMSFIFYVGWFKTAIALMNPLGDDVQDIPLSQILDYNMMISIRGGGIAVEDHFYPGRMIEAKSCLSPEEEADVEGPRGMEAIKLEENVTEASKLKPAPSPQTEPKDAADKV